MFPLSVTIPESRGVRRVDYPIEQGIPVNAIDPSVLENLRLVLEDGRVIPAGFEPESIDENGKVRWIRASVPVNLSANDTIKASIEERPDLTNPIPELKIEKNEGTITIVHPQFRMEFTNPGRVSLTTDSGNILDGDIDMVLRSDSRSSVGGHRPVRFQGEGFEILQEAPHRVLVRLNGRVLCLAPKQKEISDKQRFDFDLEFRIYSFSNTIRLKWRITSFLTWNCNYLWLERYSLELPLAEGARMVLGERTDTENIFTHWATAKTDAGFLSASAYYHAWLGKGAGIQFKDGKLCMGGINPPIDTGFAEPVPNIHRQFFYGMSRSFEASIIVNGTQDQVEAELKPIALVIPAQHYADCGELPEAGIEVDFGEWKDKVDRSAEILLKTQWKGTLWWGEWWREWDVERQMGIEESGNGNASVAPLYHFYRTGDVRFWECAKAAFYRISDIQLCKSEKRGPYLHTRRFLLDHQDWYHMRYQRIGGIIRPSHLFCDERARREAIDMTRFWGKNCVSEDGYPLYPNADGSKSKMSETAMLNFAESLLFCYRETGDPFFLDTAERMGDMMIRRMNGEDNEFDEKPIANWNDSQYVMRGMLSLVHQSGKPQYKEALHKLAKLTLEHPEWQMSMDFVLFNIAELVPAAVMHNDKQILLDLLPKVEWAISGEAPDGTYPFVNNYQYPPAVWLQFYMTKGVVAYLPAMSAALRWMEDSTKE